MAFTTKPGKLFVIQFQWPGELLELPRMKSKVNHACLLAAPEASLVITHETGRILISLPAEAPSKIASVIALNLASEQINRSRIK